MLSKWSAFPVLDRLFDDVLSEVSGSALGKGGTHTNFVPAVDVRANDNEVVFVCDVPGLTHEDLELTLENGVLTIMGRRRYESGDSERVWLGRTYGQFIRSFAIPAGVDTDNLTADLSNGVLTIRLPKTAQAKPRRVQIGGGESRNGEGESQVADAKSE